MNLEERESLIREQRLIEATKKRLIGPTGKFGIILKAYGEPIFRQGSLYTSANYLDDIDDFTTTDYESTASGQLGPVVSRDEILMSDDSIQETGLLFDGLNKGIHLEIIYWQNDAILRATYKGYLIYEEINSELQAFVPNVEWERIVDRLSDTAETKLKSMKIEEKAMKLMQIEKVKGSFLQKMRQRWGF